MLFVFKCDFGKSLYRSAFDIIEIVHGHTQLPCHLFWRSAFYHQQTDYQGVTLVLHLS